MKLLFLFSCLFTVIYPSIVWALQSDRSSVGQVNGLHLRLFVATDLEATKTFENKFPGTLPDTSYFLSIKQLLEYTNKVLTQVNIHLIVSARDVWKRRLIKEHESYSDDIEENKRLLEKTAGDAWYIPVKDFDLGVMMSGKNYPVKYDASQNPEKYHGVGGGSEACPGEGYTRSFIVLPLFYDSREQPVNVIGRELARLIFKTIITFPTDHNCSQEPCKCIFDLDSNSTVIPKCFVDELKQQMEFSFPEVICLEVDPKAVMSFFDICGNGIQESSELCDCHAFDSKCQCYYDCKSTVTTTTTTQRPTTAASTVKTTVTETMETTIEETTTATVAVKVDPLIILVIVATIGTAVSITVIVTTFVVVRNRKKRRLFSTAKRIRTENETLSSAASLKSNEEVVQQQQSQAC